MITRQTNGQVGRKIMENT